MTNTSKTWKSSATNNNGWTKIKVKKCVLFQMQVKYLGHFVTAAGVSMDEDKIRVVKDWSRS